MRVRKRRNAFLLILLVYVTLTPLAQPSSANEQLLTRVEATEKYGIGYTAWGLGIAADRLPLAPISLSIMPGNLPRVECRGISDPNCTDSEDLYQTLYLDLCNETSQLSCIAGVWVRDLNGKVYQGVLEDRYLLAEANTVKEDVERNLPASSSKGAIWKFSGVEGSESSFRLFTFTFVTMFKNVGKRKFGYGEINSSIVPVKPAESKGRLIDDQECVGVVGSICQKPVDFPTGLRVGLTLRLGEKLDGWFHGRLTKPEIVVKGWKNGQEISVEGEPVKVPSIDFVVPKVQLSNELQALFAIDSRDAGVLAALQGQCVASSTMSCIAQTGGNLAHPRTMQLVTDFAPVYGDRATVTSSYWSFKNMFNHAGGFDQSSITRCTKSEDSLMGLILTNALTYSSGPPTFDQGSGALVYKVASPHYEASGQVASGTYDLTLRSDVARCIYGLSNAPIRAEVTITGDEGEKRIATTVVNEKDGWLYLSAKGFTFSAPVIRVKLSEDKAVEAKPVATPTPEASATLSTSNQQSGVTKSPTKKTITCVKGAQKKRVSGSKPVCPKGFKKA